MTTVKNALLIGVAGVCFLVGTFVAYGFGSWLVTDEPPGDCYAIVDAVGQRHTSKAPPVAMEGVNGWVYNSDGEWGFVPAPRVISVDKDCLRAKGVKIPPVEGD